MERDTKMKQAATSSAMLELWRVLSRQKVKIALSFLLIMGGVAAFTLLSPKTYRSQAKLFLRLGRENATLDPTATLGQTPVVVVPATRENEINSVIEILKSRVLLEKVVAAVGPRIILGTARAAADAAATAGTADPDVSPQERERAITTLAKMLDAEAAKKSAIIQVSCEASSPELAQTIAAKLVDCYLDLHVLLNRTPGADQFLTEQTDRLRTQLARLENELRDLKNETGLFAPEGQRQALVTRLARLQDELLQAETATTATEAEAQLLRGKLAALPPTQVTAQTKGFPNEANDRLREQLYTLQVKEAELLARYPEQHPEVKQVREQTAKAQALLRQEEKSREQIVTGPNRLFEEAQLALIRLEPQLAALRARSTVLREQLEKERSALKTLNDNDLRLAKLQREVDLNAAEYRKYAENLEQTRIDQALKLEKISNISIAQPATCELNPVRPRLLFNFGVGLVLAVLGSGGLAFLAEYRSRGS
jgi:uncharacterized protein involved in exopolysaccharide biosynthesis